ncbi:hypothetical protein BC829DRAFT_257321 [Chytridium lagenaria]|nr:hypothetical protein BC829DRAFT_257321 [Chytridium lagenaria]
MVLRSTTKPTDGIVLDQDLLTDPAPGLAPVFRVVGTIINAVEGMKVDRARTLRMAQRIQTITLDLNAACLASAPTQPTTLDKDPFFAISSTSTPTSPRRSVSASSLSASIPPPPPPQIVPASPSKRSSIYGAVFDMVSRSTTTTTPSLDPSVAPPPSPSHVNPRNPSTHPPPPPSPS